MNNIDKSQIIQDINKFGLNEHIESFIIHGSVLFGKNSPTSDQDICVVLRTRGLEVLNKLKALLDNHFNNIDLTLYYLDEIDPKLPFRDIGMGVFALNYLALGESIYGENIFVKQLDNIDPNLYRQSLREKISDYILRLRRVYISDDFLVNKIRYYKKYLSRLLIDIFLFTKDESLPNLILLSPNEIFQLAYDKSYISEPLHFKDSNESQELLDKYYSTLEQLSTSLIKGKFN